jgi:hypothetical protein
MIATMTANKNEINWRRVVLMPFISQRALSVYVFTANWPILK